VVERDPALAVRVTTPLRGFDLDIELETRAGETLALVGPSGAGKTSLLRAIAGLLRPRAGRVALGEEVWLDTDRGLEVPSERRRCGLVFQDYALFGTMSVGRNVAYGAAGPRAQRRAAALAMLERFGAAHLADARPDSLSGGERQRVALARALAAAPRALLLDEPLAALDPSTRRGALRELATALEELAVPAVLVTHSFEEAALLAPRLAIVDRGAVVQAGTPAEISTRPRSTFVADFAGAAVLRGEARGESDGLTLVRLEGGGEVRSIDPGRGRVAVSVYPWEITLEAPPPQAMHSFSPQSGGSERIASGLQQSPDLAPNRRIASGLEQRRDSALNHVEAEVTSVVRIGNRARIGLALPQPLGAEVTPRSAATMGLRPGTRVVAAWKASATRLMPLCGEDRCEFWSR
jgi:molybdate transport system ATP-binding protein